MMNLINEEMIEEYYVGSIKEIEMIDEAIVSIQELISKFDDINSKERLTRTINTLEEKKESIKRSIK